MFWPGIKEKLVNVKQFYGNTYPLYFKFIREAGFTQDGFTMGYSPDEKDRFDWVKIFSGHHETTGAPLAIIQKVVNGSRKRIVIKEEALVDWLPESIYRYNEIWEWLE